MKDKILRGWRNIPVKNLANYVKRGDVTLSELKAAGLPTEREFIIQNILRSDDDALWKNVQQENCIESYQRYITQYPDGFHKDEALAELQNLEEKEWQSVQSNLTEMSLTQYLQRFPNGMHAVECHQLLDDLPWLNAKQSNTIRDYQDYMLQYPGKHDAEARQAISYLNDDNDWNNACLMGNSDAYRYYMEQHPNGKHVVEARNRIQSSAGKDRLLSELRTDPNAYGAIEIQNNVYNNVATWDDIAKIFGPEKTAAIRNFDSSEDLPSSNPPMVLQPDSTEVYFWGTPSSGKTCALGSIISSMKSKGIYEAMECASLRYMIELSNVFVTNGFCKFPGSSPVECIQEMIMNISDSKKRSHKVTLIDMAGELFRSVFFKQNNFFLPEEKENTLNTALSYLKDCRNNKIHFFVVEYGAHDKKWEKLTMVDYLDTMMRFLTNEKVFKKSTVGVYVLVTKCDMIHCDYEDRPKMAFDYVTQQLPSFWNALQKNCNNAGIKDLKVLSYSVGDVFAQNLCKFDNRDTNKVIEKLLINTYGDGSWYDWLRG